MKFKGDFKVKSLNKKSVVIEGIANKAIVDRGDDLIPAEAWELDEFKQNPIMFFNHDRNIPIGKALDIYTSEEGLHIKAQISNSKAAPMPFIRDMIAEGVLRTFSVGFDPKGSIEQKDGINVINRANLLEVSVVSIPMNQASTFDVKAWKNKSYEAAVTDVLRQKGCMMAARFHDHICMAQNGVEGFDKKEALKMLSKKSGIDMQGVLDILAGVVTPVPESFVKAFSQVFMISTEWLLEDAQYELKITGKESVERGSSELEKKESESELKPIDGESDEDKEKPEGKEADKEDKKEKSNKIHDRVKTNSEAVEKGDAVNELEKTILLFQGLPSKLVGKLLDAAKLIADSKEVNYELLCKSLITLNDLVSQGMSAKSVASLISSKIPELANCKDEFAELAEIIESAGLKTEGSEDDEVGEEEEKGSKPDEEEMNEDKKEDMDDEDSEEDKEKQADQNNVDMPTTPVSDKSDDETEFGNPHLTVAKSHMALTGALLQELKLLNNSISEVRDLMKDSAVAKVAEAPMPADEDEAEEQAEESADDQESKESVRLRTALVNRKKELIRNFEERIKAYV